MWLRRTLVFAIAAALALVLPVAASSAFSVSLGVGRHHARSAHASKTTKPDKPAKPEKSDKADKPGKSEKSDKPEKSDKSEKSDKPTKSEKDESAKPTKSDKSDKPTKSDKDDKDGSDKGSTDNGSSGDSSTDNSPSGGSNDHSDSGDGQPNTSAGSGAGGNPDRGGSLGGDGQNAADPVVGRSVNATPEDGNVTVTTPGSTGPVSLSKLSNVPVGSIIDASAGAVTITAAQDSSGHVQQATFSGGAFQVRQDKGDSPVTDIYLHGGGLGSCPIHPPGNAVAPARALAPDALFGRANALAPGNAVRPGNGLSRLLARSSSTRHRYGRHLWGSGHGRFRTHGVNSVASVLGTIWLTEDSCDGTVTVVRRGLVAVRDLNGHRTVRVPAGHSYFAPAQR